MCSQSWFSDRSKDCLSGSTGRIALNPADIESGIYLSGCYIHFKQLNATKSTRLLVDIVNGFDFVLLASRTPFVLRCVIAVCVSIMMEGLIALVVTFAQHGLTSGWSLVWATTVVKALPLGLLVGVTMTFIVQPRMQRLAASAPAN
ncbi:hypothetical protein CH54_370 [Yersinia rochesterensis]|nr:hypothetical protein DJ57_1224 [Yersinia rochesterensis]AJI86948.1 hypothetical protein AW19_1292 [Yersinia frederiksenii Y225]AJJ33954.1 hypothetical protein CH54_370 [Yersinia rochesterensis]CNH34890.1 Protein of uncharacterised function (DUF2798) [Yersinia kristensenii]CRY63927.1 Protein of uncharacterised function (DUF2798) [Yersinia kristensenii]